MSFLTISCHSVSIRENSNCNNPLSLIEISTYDDNVFVGVSGVYSTKEKMLEEAILDCARNVLINEYLALKIVSYLENNRYIYFKSDDKIVYKDETIVDVIENLDIFSINFDSKLGCIVFAKNSTVKGKKRPFQTVCNSEGIPNWILKLPIIEGYYISVGKVSEYSTIRKSIEASDFNAIENMFSQVGDLESFVVDLQYKKDRNNYNIYYSESYQGKIGVVSGVQVISHWYDERNKEYYSLAILKRSNL